jgi:hypothetical protein
MKENKRMYTAPAMERIPLETGMVALGGSGLGDYDGVAGSDLFLSAPTSRRTFSTYSETESMVNSINDFFTVGQ